MRIRSKRFAPSDLRQIQSLSDEIPKSDQPPSNPPPPSSDQNTVICSEIIAEKVEQEKLESEEVEEKHGDADIKNARILVQDVNVKVLQPSSSSDIDTGYIQSDGRWIEGNKIVPFKKRKGTSERCAIDDALSKDRMKSKTNEKCSLTNRDDDEIDDTNDVNIIDDTNDVNIHSANKSKKKKGNIIMEGSRCSRVNGRGWRCCKPTLVGYALCEHHLGKGRLRSMTSCVRKRSISSAKTKNESSLTGTTTRPVSPIMRVLEVESKGLRDTDDIDEEKPALVVTKKRSKIGTVKARSISSLLDQIDSEVRK